MILQKVHSNGPQIEVRIPQAFPDMERIDILGKYRIIRYD